MAVLHNPNPTSSRTTIDRFFAAALNAGCPRDQVENFLSAGIILQPKQLLASAAARECDKEDGPTEVGFGGAMGPGKSHWMLAQMGADDCQRIPGLKCLLLRKVGRSNREQLEDLRLRCLMGLKHDYNRSHGSITFANGSRILCGHYQHEKDVESYLGLEYDTIGVEEATTLTSSKIKTINTRRRTSKRGWRPRSYYTFNPGGVGHAYFKAQFITPWRRGQQTDTRFIFATATDNAALNSGYRKTLDSLVGWQRAAWRDGDWDIAAGQFFTTFRSDVHVLHDFTLPRGWTVWGSLDYGFTHYTAFHLLAESGDGDVIIVDEHGERGWLPARHAAAIEALCARHGLHPLELRRIVAGPDVFAKKQDGGTIADDYRELGLTLWPANTDRINGAAEILSRLGDVEAGIRPSLFISDRCARLLETLPALEHDPHRPEDVLKWDVGEDGLGGDDWYDSARYGVLEAARRIPTSGSHSPIPQAQRGDPFRANRGVVNPFAR